MGFGSWGDDARSVREMLAEESKLWKREGGRAVFNTARHLILYSRRSRQRLDHVGLRILLGISISTTTIAADSGFIRHRFFWSTASTLLWKWLPFDPIVKGKLHRQCACEGKPVPRQMPTPISSLMIPIVEIHKAHNHPFETPPTFVLSLTG